MRDSEANYIHLNTRIKLKSAFTPTVNRVPHRSQNKTLWDHNSERWGLKPAITTTYYTELIMFMRTTENLLRNSKTKRMDFFLHHCMCSGVHQMTVESMNTSDKWLLLVLSWCCSAMHIWLYACNEQSCKLYQSRHHRSDPARLCPLTLWVQSWEFLSLATTALEHGNLHTAISTL